MPAIHAIITHGTITASGLLDEPNILVQSLTVTPAREKKIYKGATGSTTALQFKDPTLKFDFDGYISTDDGLAKEHPGTAVAALANYAGAIHGFDNTDGVMVYEDPVRELSQDDPLKIKFSVVQYPFIGSAA